MFLIWLFLMSFSSLHANDYYEIGRSFAKDKSLEKEILKQELKAVKQQVASTPISKSEINGRKKCAISSNTLEPNSNSLYVFVSFSLSEQTWLQLSKEMEKLGGILVLRGIPENSFKKFALKMRGLHQKGLKSHVQIEPRLFSRFQIEKVPTFVTVDSETFDKVCGNISLKFALEKMTTNSAKKLMELL